MDQSNALLFPKEVRVLLVLLRRCRNYATANSGTIINKSIEIDPTRHYSFKVSKIVLAVIDTIKKILVSKLYTGVKTIRKLCAGPVTSTNTTSSS